MTDRERVLLVEDVPELATLYELWLEPAYDVSTASTGELALEQVDHETDIVLLDRLLPDQNGETVLQTIRERGFDCSVVMITAVQPGLDLLDLPVDDYLTKPFTSTELRETVARILRRRAYEDDLGRWFALVSKRAAIEQTLDTGTLRSNPAYRELLDQIDAHRPDRQTVQASLDDAAATALFTDT